MGIEELLIFLGIFYAHSYIDLKLESDMLQEIACFTQQLYKLASIRGRSLKIKF